MGNLNLSKDVSIDAGNVENNTHNANNQEDHID